MSGHLCLKWNNHSSAFLRSISSIHIKERYCDATIACQGKYFPVHRIILSTCSDYFEEMFERMQSPHPYIVFKDIEPREMELLLNYMYQGEVNVVQEMLPSLIKAAEALRIKGLAVPDEMPPTKDSSSSSLSSGKKRSNTSAENPQPKRRSEGNRRRDSTDLSTTIETENRDNAIDSNIGTNDFEQSSSLYTGYQAKDRDPVVKQEPVDSSDYNNEPVPNMADISSHPIDNQFLNKEENIFADYPLPPDSYIKSEDPGSMNEPYQDQPPSSWANFSAANHLESLSSSEMSKQDNVRQTNEESFSLRSSQIDPNPTTSFVPQGPEIRLHPNAKANLKPKNRFHLCPHCDYKSSSRSYIKSHIQFKHTLERPFVCSLCGLRFTLSKDLRRHMLIHTGEKPFQCPRCLQKFRHSNSLKNHMTKKPDCGRMLCGRMY